MSTLDDEYFRKLNAAREADRAERVSGEKLGTTHQLPDGQEVTIHVSHETSFFNRRLIEAAWGKPPFYFDDDENWGNRDF
jgi:hypothetical protein